MLGHIRSMIMPKAQVREREYPVYVGAIREGVRAEILGGPYNDIDDAMDRCWDAMADGIAKSPSLFLIETGSGIPTVYTIPKGALPPDD